MDDKRDGEERKDGGKSGNLLHYDSFIYGDVFMGSPPGADPVALLAAIVAK